MVEEFCSFTDLPIVTPSNAEQLLEVMAPSGQLAAHLALQKRCSGSAWLSKVAHQPFKAALFPADFRYGWGTGLLERQQLFTKVKRGLQLLAL